jgi:hypothetical protein
VLLCADAAGAAAAVAGGQLGCLCGRGRLAPWGHARQRVIALPGGTQARLKPARACRRTQVLLPGWCAPRQAHCIAIIATAAGAARKGTGHRVIAARLDVAAGTVRGWLRRLRARAEPLRWPSPCTPPGPAWATARTSPGRSWVPWAWGTPPCSPLAGDHLCGSRAPPCPHPGPGPAPPLPVTATAAVMTNPATA